MDYKLQHYLSDDLNNKKGSLEPIQQNTTAQVRDDPVTEKLKNALKLKSKKQQLIELKNFSHWLKEERPSFLNAFHESGILDFYIESFDSLDISVHRVFISILETYDCNSNSEVLDIISKTVLINKFIQKVLSCQNEQSYYFLRQIAILSQNESMRQIIHESFSFNILETLYQKGVIPAVLHFLTLFAIKGTITQNEFEVFYNIANDILNKHILSQEIYACISQYVKFELFWKTDMPNSVMNIFIGVTPKTASTSLAEIVRHMAIQNVDYVMPYITIFVDVLEIQASEIGFIRCIFNILSIIIDKERSNLDANLLMKIVNIGFNKIQENSEDSRTIEEILITVALISTITTKDFLSELVENDAIQFLVRNITVDSERSTSALLLIIDQLLPICVEKEKMEIIEEVGEDLSEMLNKISENSSNEDILARVGHIRSTIGDE